MQEATFDIMKIVGRLTPRQNESSPNQAHATNRDCESSPSDQSRKSLRRGTQDLNGFRRNCFIRVIRIAPIRITLETAHDGFIGLVENGA